MIYNVLKMIKIVLTFHSINLYSSSGTRFYDSNRKSKSLQQCLIQIVVMEKHMQWKQQISVVIIITT